MTATKSTGHSSKHVSSKKHEGTSKHSPTAKKTTKSGTKGHVTTKAKHATHAKARGWAIGDLLPVCAAEAVAMSLRLAGQRVGADEVEWLWLNAGGWDGASLAGTLAAAARIGVAGFRPVAVQVLDDAPLPGGHRLDVEHVDLSEVDDGLGERLFHGLLRCRLVPALDEQVIDDVNDELVVLQCGQRIGLDLLGREAAQFHALADLVPDRSLAHALILGISVPGPHCVLATAAGWWSWGKLWDPWPCAIEEAVAVSWS